MSTRDEMRRELKDLAKMGATLNKGRQSAPPPPVDYASGSRVTVPPAVTSLLATYPPPGQTRPPPPSSLPSPRPPAPKAYRPESIPPPPRPMSPSAPTSKFVPAGAGSPPPQASLWRGGWAIVSASTLAAAMIGGLLLGQALTSKRAPGAARVADTAAAPKVRTPERSEVSDRHEPGKAIAAAAAPAEPSPASTNAGSTSPPTAAVTVAAPIPVTVPPSADYPPGDPQANLTITGACPPPVIIRAPRLVRHAQPAGFSRATLATPNTMLPARSSVATKGAPGPRLAAQSALDDLIRKAAAGN